MNFPTIPPLPQQPAPSLAEQLQHFQLQLYLADLEQRAATETATAARHAAWVAEIAEIDRRHREKMEQDRKCAEAQDKHRETMERILAEGMPLDAPSAEALEATRVAVEALRVAIENWRPGPTSGGGSGGGEREDQKLSASEVDLAVRLVEAARK